MRKQIKNLSWILILTTILFYGDLAFSKGETMTFTIRWEGVEKTEFNLVIYDSKNKVVKNIKTKGNKYKFKTNSIGTYFTRLRYRPEGTSIWSYFSQPSKIEAKDLVEDVPPPEVSIISPANKDTIDDIPVNFEWEIKPRSDKKYPHELQQYLVLVDEKKRKKTAKVSTNNRSKKAKLKPGVYAWRVELRNKFKELVSKSSVTKFKLKKPSESFFKKLRYSAGVQLGSVSVNDSNRLTTMNYFKVPLGISYKLSDDLGLSGEVAVTNFYSIEFESSAVESEGSNIYFDYSLNLSKKLNEKSHLVFGYSLLNYFLYEEVDDSILLSPVLVNRLSTMGLYSFDEKWRTFVKLGLLASVDGHVGGDLAAGVLYTDQILNFPLTLGLSLYHGSVTDESSIETKSQAFAVNATTSF